MRTGPEISLLDSVIFPTSVGGCQTSCPFAPIGAAPPFLLGPSTTDSDMMFTSEKLAHRAQAAEEDPDEVTDTPPGPHGNRALPARESSDTDDSTPDVRTRLACRDSTPHERESLCRQESLPVTYTLHSPSPGVDRQGRIRRMMQRPGAFRASQSCSHEQRGTDRAMFGYLLDSQWPCVMRATLGAPDSFEWAPVYATRLALFDFCVSTGAQPAADPAGARLSKLPFRFPATLFTPLLCRSCAEFWGLQAGDV